MVTLMMTTIMFFCISKYTPHDDGDGNNDDSNDKLFFIEIMAYGLAFCVVAKII